MKTQLLLVEDDYDDQEIFSMALQEVNIPINYAVARNGIEALQKLACDRSYIPNFIFIDINMPKMNGIELLREIRKLEHLKNSRIIMLSTSAEEAIVYQCQELGANDFLEKPPAISLLAESLRQFCKE